MTRQAPLGAATDHPRQGGTSDHAGPEPPTLSHVAHPWVVPERIESREFQVNLAVTAAQDPCLVVLPTGLGKTVVALLVMADRLARDPNSKVVLLAPTKPLVEQHRSFFRDHLAFPGTEADDLDRDAAVVAFSGDIPPDKRTDMWHKAKVVVATPQVIENDLIGNRYHLRDVSLVVFDEAHRATGDYPYVWLSEQYLHDNPQGHRMGLTASPGSSSEKILEVCGNLGLSRMEIRTEQDADVKPYVHELEVQWEKVPLPGPLKDIADRLRAAIAARVQALKGLGLLKGAGSQPTRKELLTLAGEIQSRIRMSDDPDRGLFDAMSLQAQALKIHHALELVETQGAPGFLNYWERLKNEASGKGASKATGAILADPRLEEAVRAAAAVGLDDHKLDKITDAVRVELVAGDDPRIIVFANYRDTCLRIVEHLKKIPGAKPVRFVGQSSREGDKGLTQKAQKELVQAFRDGTYNVLVATSVAEEGLDIPQTDLVVFNEPVPSEIRAIQRRGRTARHRKGRVLVLMYGGTRDEAYYWASTRRERNMRRELRALQTTVSRELRHGGGHGKGVPAPRRQGQTTLAQAADAMPATEPKAPTAREAPGPKPETAPEVPRPIPETAPVPPERERPQAEPQTQPQTEPQTEPQAAPQTAPKGEPRTEPESTSAGGLPPRLRQHHDPQATVRDYFGAPKGQDGAVRILVDHRESRSGVVKALARRGVQIETAQLSVADYALSDRVAVERKNTEDFLGSLMDGRLFQQARQLTGYLRPIMILEGEGLLTSRNIPRGSVFGALASLATDFGITVLQTATVDDTADLLVTIAKREQTETRRQAPVRLDKVAMSDEDRRRFIVEGLPNVSGVLAKRLLQHFGTVQAVMDASEDDLCGVDGVGRKTAREIRRVLVMQRSGKAKGGP